MSRPWAAGLLALLLWAAAVAAALLTRPPLPMDETRYLAVAWEMWRDGDFLVPHLNGEPYSHKPPLLFWLMNLTWAVHGVNDLTPRLVAPLFGLGCLVLTGLIARRLWPARPEAAALAPLLLLGSVFWAFFTTLTMFDLVLAFFALLGLLGLLRAWRCGCRLGWGLFALGIGLGVLAKGPAILLHLLPAALLAPLWGPRLEGAAPQPGGLGGWYRTVLLSVLAGAVLALAWAVPAAIRGGEEFRNAIFWGQTAGRVVQSFAHQRPWWWYLALILPLLLPWALWPPLWRALIGGGRRLLDGGALFALVWFVPAFAAFSAISGKQLHYLLPDFPALALLAAHLLAGRQEEPGRRFDQAPPGILLLAAGAAGAAAPLLARLVRLPDEAAEIDGWWLLAVAALALITLRWRPAALSARVALLAAAGAATVAAAHLAARPALLQSVDLRPVAEKLKELEDAGHPLANYGKYHGQYQFLGRLARPIDIVGDQEVEAWMAGHPEGRIVTYQRELPAGGTPLYVREFRNRVVSIWDVADVRADPSLVRRGAD